MIALNEPLSDQEIAELDQFLMSDATPEESMSINELDGFLTSLVIEVWSHSLGGNSSGLGRRERAEVRIVASAVQHAQFLARGAAGV